MKRWMKIAGIGSLMTVLASGSAFAGQWVQDTTRPETADGVTNWRWINDDGSFPHGTWVWLDGNQDGIAERYYFTPLREAEGEETGGYMMADTMAPINNTAAIPKADETDHGNQVDEDGAWIVDGVVQTMEVPVPEIVPVERTCQVREDIPYHLSGMRMVDVKMQHSDQTFRQTGYAIDADGAMTSKYHMELEGMDITLLVNDGVITGFSIPWGQILPGIPASCSGQEFLDILIKAGMEAAQVEGRCSWDYHGFRFSRPSDCRNQYDYAELAEIIPVPVS